VDQSGSELLGEIWRISRNSSETLDGAGTVAECETESGSDHADRAARVSPVDLNIVAQTTDFAEGEGFDLVVATNILLYYDHLQQALAMSNIARMMNTGGIFVSNTPLAVGARRKVEISGREKRGVRARRLVWRRRSGLSATMSRVYG